MAENTCSAPPLAEDRIEALKAIIEFNVSDRKVQYEESRIVRILEEYRKYTLHNPRSSREDTEELQNDLLLQHLKIQEARKARRTRVDLLVKALPSAIGEGAEITVYETVYRSVGGKLLQVFRGSHLQPEGDGFVEVEKDFLLEVDSAKFSYGFAFGRWSQVEELLEQL